MKVEYSDENGVKSVNTAFRIVDQIKDDGGCRVSDLTSALDVSKSTIHRYLNTLESHGYVVQENNTYSIGLRFMEMSHHARQQKGMYGIAEELTKTIAERTGDRATFVTEENGLGIIIAMEIGEHGIYADSSVGQRFYLHASSVGKAMLASYPRRRVDEIVEHHGLVALTDNTITDRARLYETLDTIRQQGYALNTAERIDGVHAVATPVSRRDDTAIGAFGISAPSRRMSESRIEDELVDLLLEISEEFELRNQYSEPP